MTTPIHDEVWREIYAPDVDDPTAVPQRWSAAEKFSAAGSVAFLILLAVILVLG